MSDRLDREIDEALRTILDGDGPADLRARVLGRIAARRRSTPVWGGLAAAAVILVALVAGALLLRREAPRPVAVLGAAVPPASQAVASTAAAAVAVVPSVRPTRRVVREPVFARPADEPMAGGIMALADPAPLQFVPLAGSRVELASIDITVLEIEDLRIEALPERP